MDGGNAASDAIATVLPNPAEPKDPLNRLILAKVKAEIETLNEVGGVGPIRGALSGPVNRSWMERDLVVVGRASAVRKVRITRIEVTTNLPPLLGDTERVQVTGTLRITPIDGLSTQIGDVGDPVLTEDGLLVGVVISSTESRTLVAPLAPILDQLDWELDLR